MFYCHRCSHIRGRGYLSRIPADEIDKAFEDDNIRVFKFYAADYDSTFENFTEVMQKAGQVSRSKYTAVPQSKTQYLHFRSHAEYFLLSLKKVMSRRSILFHN